MINESVVHSVLHSSIVVAGTGYPLFGRVHAVLKVSVLLKYVNWLACNFTMSCIVVQWDENLTYSCKEAMAILSINVASLIGTTSSLHYVSDALYIL